MKVISKTVVEKITFTEEELAFLAKLHLTLDTICHNTQHCCDCILWNVYDSAGAEECENLKNLISNIVEDKQIP